MPLNRRRQALLAGILAMLVIAVLGYLLHARYSESRTYGRERALKSDLFLMRDAIDEYRARTGQCPVSLDTLVNAQYLRGVPTDPFTRSSASWRYSAADCDVKSTSPGQASNGSRYADW
jgi:general secretion pathway protein G